MNYFIELNLKYLIKIMLKEIYSKQFKNKKINLEVKKFFSPRKAKETKENNEIKKNKNPSFKSLDSSSKKNNKNITKKTNKPLLENKINIIINRPDYLIDQGKESTIPITTFNKLQMYNELAKYIKTPTNENEKMKTNNIYNTYNKTKNKESNLSNSEKDNINDKIAQKFKEINIKQNNYIINEDKTKEVSKQILPKNEETTKPIIHKDKDRGISQLNFQNDEIPNNLCDSKTRTKPETSKSFELNMSVLSEEGIEKLKLLEGYIAQIKENSSNLNEAKIQELQEKKMALENNINILTNYIRLNNKKYKDNIKLKKKFELEKEKVEYDSNKINKDDIMKELPYIRVEIELMKNKIAQEKEKTKGINNYRLDIERQILEIKDELKQYNIKITNILKEKDKISNEIMSIQKKYNTLKSKVDKAEKSANEFLYNVEQLVKFTQQNKI